MNLQYATQLRYAFPHSTKTHRRPNQRRTLLNASAPNRSSKPIRFSKSYDETGKSQEAGHSKINSSRVKLVDAREEEVPNPDGADEGFDNGSAKPQYQAEKTTAPHVW